MIRHWSFLHLTEQGKAFVARIAQEWTDLITNPATNERDVLTFLRNHACLFFYDQSRPGYPVAELGLGGNRYRADFMIALEHGSLGPDYWLIEIESPNSRAYKSKPTGPVSALSVAMQQTRDWKAWINSHRLDAMRLFPSVFWKDNSSPTFRYKIIISKREWNLESSHRIQNLSQENGVEIRTFDYLTDELLQRPFYPTYLSGSSQTNSLPAEVRNTLASPFHRTLSGSDWEAILEGTEGFLSHMTSKLADRLLQRLEPGPRLAEFDDLWNAFATEDPTAASSISFVDNLMLR